MIKEKMWGILRDKVFNKVGIDRIMLVGKIFLIVFVILSAVGLWIEGGVYLLSPEEDELAGMPCYVSGETGIIEIRGEIVSYFLYSSESDTDEAGDVGDAVSSEEVVSCIDYMESNNDIKGVIVEVDSYGGSPYGSEEIMKAISGLDKPTVAVVRESALSGGYLVASAADKIFASEFSEIGGIGVTMSYLDYSQKNKADGIIYQQVSSGKFKDAGDPNKPLSDEEWELLMRDTELMHAMFTANVAVNRGLDVKKALEVADGSSMLGNMAKENGLIDEIGDINSAFSWLSEQQ